jgi:hypothetical protein
VWIGGRASVTAILPAQTAHGACGLVEYEPRVVARAGLKCRGPSGANGCGITKSRAEFINAQEQTQAMHRAESSDEFTARGM